MKAATLPFMDTRSSEARARDEIIGRSAAVAGVLDLVGRVAATDTPVLISGETGTGKELTAHTVHLRSRRAQGPFVAVNLAVIPAELVAAELFGHEQGAFTGAHQRRIGRFEMGDGGTLFLDEIGEISPAVQVALLRVLQEGEFERLGSGQTKRVDVRLVAATNQDLESAVQENRFRADLFYRLSVFPVHLPPLRDRPEDIPSLAEHILRRISQRLERHFAGIEPASLDRLLRYEWPGNIRQLQNVLERSAILCDEEWLHVPEAFTRDTAPPARRVSPLAEALTTSERQLVEDALDHARGQVSGPNGAAAMLGVSASTLESKIRRLMIDKRHFRVRRA
jgi:transcriptional regulator with GAF, ATPase, and Fis domain